MKAIDRRAHFHADGPDVVELIGGVGFDYGEFSESIQRLISVSLSFRARDAAAHH